MIEIECAGEALTLLPEKAVFWRATSTLIVADLHLGKSAAFRSFGVPVPESTTTADLDRLDSLIRITTAERLIILGDLFHSRAGLQAEMLERVTAWREEHRSLEINLVPGNHDRASAPPPAAWAFQVVAEQWRCGPFLLSHEPMQSRDGYVLAGHLHPAMVLRDKFGPTIRAPCFHFSKHCGVLPAFGSFTGMSNIEPESNDRIFVIGKGEVLAARAQ